MFYGEETMLLLTLIVVLKRFYTVLFIRPLLYNFISFGGRFVNEGPLRPFFVI